MDKLWLFHWNKNNLLLEKLKKIDPSLELCDAPDIVSKTF